MDKRSGDGRVALKIRDANTRRAPVLPAGRFVQDTGVREAASRVKQRSSGLHAPVHLAVAGDHARPGPIALRPKELDRPAAQGCPDKNFRPLGRGHVYGGSGRSKATPKRLRAPNPRRPPTPFRFRFRGTETREMHRQKISRVWVSGVALTKRDPPYT